VTRGIEYAKEGDYKKAMMYYNQALEVDPKFRDAYVARGAAYANLGMLEEAIEEFEKALAIDPEDKNAIKYFAATKQKLQEKTQNTEVQKQKDAQHAVNERLKNLLEAEVRQKKDKKIEKHKKKEKHSRKHKKNKDQYRDSSHSKYSNDESSHKKQKRKKSSEEIDSNDCEDFSKTSKKLSKKNLLSCKKRLRIQKFKNKKMHNMQ